MLAKIGQQLTRLRRSFSRTEWIAKAVSSLRSDPHPDSSAHGIIVVQIDGLGKAVLEQGLRSGRLPYLKRLLGHEGYHLNSLYSGIPSTTPAVQAELFYGEKTAVPAFSFRDHQSHRTAVMMRSKWANQVQDRLRQISPGLLQGGSSWSNIYTGGASHAESHFCGASLDARHVFTWRRLIGTVTILALHLPALLRLLAYTMVEVILALIDAVRGLLRGRSLLAEAAFVPIRALVSVGLREWVTLGAKVDSARGLPIIYANFLGYDEQAHRRGPHSAFALWTLKGIDTAIRRIHTTANRSSKRVYELYVLSDHGQIATRWFNAVHRRSLADTVQLALHGDASSGSASPRARVHCLGPVGHVYLPTSMARPELSVLARKLVQSGVPSVLFVDHDQQIRWMSPDLDVALGNDELPIEFRQKFHPDWEEDLTRLARHPDTGELVCLGWAPGHRPLTFAHENGSHGGPSTEETSAFLLHPPGTRHLFDEKSRARDVFRTLNERLRPALQKPRRIFPVFRPQELRVATYNIHYAKGLDGRFALSRIETILRELDCDLIALQEVDCGRPRSAGDDQIALLADRLGLHALFCPSIEAGAEKYGHGLLSRWPLRKLAQHRLPTGGGRVIEPRDVLIACCEWSETPIRVVSTHLGLANRERSAQIERLLADDVLRDSLAEMPELFLGDLNFAPGSTFYRRLMTGLLDAQGQPRLRDAQANLVGHTALRTFPSFFPVRTLDHVFVSEHFEIQEVRTWRTQLAREASDHLPLIVDLTLRAPRATPVNANAAHALSTPGR